MHLRHRIHSAGRRLLALVSAVLLSGATVLAAKEPQFVAPGADGRLVYDTDARGNRIPDFSHCGYRGGAAAIPDVPVRVVVPAVPGDATARIQAAIAYVAGLPPDKDGLRGAVLLQTGRHEVAGCLRITTGGVVLRGQGQGPDGTLLVATGTDRRPLIQIAGKDDRRMLLPQPLAVADDYVPVGASRLRLTSTAGLRVGDTIRIERPSTAAWIDAIGMNRFPGKTSGFNWLPGKMDIAWDRVITRIDGDTIALDAPLTTALEAAFGGGKVQSYAWPGRISQVGIENLRCISAFDPANPHDEEHAWMAITLEAVQDAWVRQVTAVHFVSSVVSVWESCKRVTVEDCTSLEPVSEIGGYRRHTFFTAGQQTLFQRCRAEHGRHDFAVGYLAAGPNAFVECEATAAHDFSGPIESWASGVLYDCVTMDGGGLLLTNREIAGQGIGWAAANCVLWQCTAPLVVCRRPPTAQNWAIGCWGQFIGDGGWRSMNEFVTPLSLYRGQLADRLGDQAVARQARRPIPTDAGDAPSIDQIIEGYTGQLTLAARLAGVSRLASRGQAAVPPPAEVKRLTLQDGWLVCDGRLLTGGRLGTVWWRGHILPSRAGELGRGVTRFVPGRTGPGYTDDLDELTDTMRADNRAVLEHHWGLWYDRRRDDHQMVRRIDGDVWPPFYEQPWARSGKGTAWDGLSKYDLTKYNPWYFGRLKEFAGLCDRKGLVLLQQMYFQHNILEAGAHWADFPWRPANCLQETGFPEPPPYVNKKRIFMADAFYDVTHPVRRALHRAYIRQCLDTLSDHTNVIYLTGAEYTGPLEFVRFWLDTISEWQAETGRQVLIGLSCTKDVQDAILADPVRGPKVSVIDLRYWWYAADGSLYAPKGGESLAPRQQWREWKGNKSQSAVQTARQVREYRRRYPDKAILCSLDRADPWAVLAAGGSIPAIPPVEDGRLLAALPRMKPFEPAGLTGQQWALAEPGRNYLVYSAGGKVRLDLSAAAGTYRARWIDPRTGKITEAQGAVHGGGLTEFDPPGSGACVLWLTCE
ncbi:MAG TPA: DUF6298 domain-containing protein [Gemmataceae bacterium]|nr:DUF6298 domain-containing protein [Gemmataceae bacterium]